MSRTFWRLCELLAKQHHKHDKREIQLERRDIPLNTQESEMAFKVEVEAGVETVTSSPRGRSRSVRSQSGSDSGADSDASTRAVNMLSLDSIVNTDSNEFDVQSLSSFSNMSQHSKPMQFDDGSASVLNFKPTEPLKITCLTIGSRGDVQPYIALCKGLLDEGHQPRIATHKEFEPWIRSYGIDFAPVEGDPAELMRICVEHGMFTYSFLREASSKFRGWIDDLLASSWKSCQGSDILIESPSAMAGIHIAEALGIPYFRAFTMPWSLTREYPHAFAVRDRNLGGSYNYITYVMFDNLFWKAISGQVNRWRREQLGLQNTSLAKMQPDKVPFLYNFSPSVVPRPRDYPDWVRITGYWSLDEATDWTPPEDLLDFINESRAQKKKIVYVGFGSIVVADPGAMTNTIIESVTRVGVRCILSRGWSQRLADPSKLTPELPMTADIFEIKAVPHDWLFKQVDAVAHHGGAGTTGASLKAGVPTIVKPFFGDQFFFGSRVSALGVGVCMAKLNKDGFMRALWEATNREGMIIKAKQLGQKIRAENGVDRAIEAIYRDLEHAKTTTLLRQNAAQSTADNSAPEESEADYEIDDIDESWTFIGDDMFHSGLQDDTIDFGVHIDGAVAGTLPPEDDDEEDVAC